MANCLPFKLFNALRPVTTTYVKYWNQIMFNGRLIMMTRDFSEAKQSSDSESKPPQNNSSDGNTYNCKEYFSYSMFSYYDIDAECVNKRIPQPKADFKEVDA